MLRLLYDASTSLSCKPARPSDDVRVQEAPEGYELYIEISLHSSPLEANVTTLKAGFVGGKVLLGP